MTSHGAKTLPSGMPEQMALASATPVGSPSSPLTSLQISTTKQKGFFSSASVTFCTAHDILNIHFPVCMCNCLIVY